MKPSFASDGTETLIVQQIYGGRTPHPLQLLVAAVAFSCLGIALARQFFEAHVGMISLFFCVLGLLPTLGSLVDRKKRKSRGSRRSSGNVHRPDVRLGVSILAIFLGVMLAYGVWNLALPIEQVRRSFGAQLQPWLGLTSPGFEVGTLSGILVHNLIVAAGVFLLSVLYRNGGALLVLAWNASVWGSAFAYFARLEWGGGWSAVRGWVGLSAGVFPHVLLEAAGYILAAFVGLLALRLAVRFGDEGIDRRGLLIAIAQLGVIAVGCLAFAAVVEVALAPRLIALLASQ